MRHKQTNPYENKRDICAELEPGPEIRGREGNIP